MAYQTGKRPVTQPAKGDATGGVKIGPTPAPTKKYVNPVLVERVEPMNYGNAKNLGPSSVEPGTSDTSPLADELRRVAAEGDAGDLIGDIIQHGTARDATVDLASLQTRPFTNEQDVPTKPGMARQTTPSKVGDVVVGSLPSKLGESVAADPTDPYAK
jgi:hypothetical protein